MGLCTLTTIFPAAGKNAWVAAWAASPVQHVAKTATHRTQPNEQSVFMNESLNHDRAGYPEAKFEAARPITHSPCRSTAKEQTAAPSRAGAIA